MAAPYQRKYEPNPKHKWPKGYGSLCPRSLDSADVDALLQDAVLVETGEAPTLYAVKENWCFEIRPTRLEVGLWHGYPVPGFEVPHDAFVQLREAGRLTAAQVKRLRRQRELPEDEL